jgi:hypothetical protein
MTASLDIQTKRVDHVLTVPVQSIIILRDSSEMKKQASKDVKTSSPDKEVKIKEAVYVYKDGKAIAKPVKTGIQDNYFIEIKEGLSEKDEVITGPYTILSKRLKDGMLVTRTDKKELFKPAKK